MVNHLLPSIKTIAIASLLTGFFVSQCLAEQTSSGAGIEVIWRSDHATQQGLSQAFERLYVSLYNTGNLPVRVIDDPAKTAQTVASLLRAENLYFGDYFPVGVDAVMCDLNPAICHRNRRRVSFKQLTSITDHVGGYLKNAGSWRNNAKTPIVVPALDFKTYVRIGQRSVGPGTDIDQLIADLDADCSQWKVSCENLVHRLNRAYFDEKRQTALKPKTLKLPFTGYETQIVLDDEASDGKGTLLQGFKTLRRNSVLQKSEENQFTDTWRRYLNKINKAEKGIQALEGYIQSFGAAQYQGFPDTHFALQGKLLQLINHPFSENNSIPDYLKVPVTIAVLDFAFDKQHCELTASVNLDAELQTGPAANFDRQPAADCGSIMASQPNSAQDHGTHVAGIIAASGQNAKGIVGLNPYAKLSYVALDPVRLGQSQYRDRVATKLIALGIQSADPAQAISVANLSWLYHNNTGGGDAIASSIDSLSDTTLFVVAAGNDNQFYKRRDICADYPACYASKDNVITVVGLNRDKSQPDLWRESDDRGSNASVEFGIAAIAAGILSTTYGNHTGRMSGTSQAAPQVSAAASLINSRFRQQFASEQAELLPIRIKNRLIYTSDLFNQLLVKVQGGRLNVGRALDMARDYLVVETTGGLLQAHHGTISVFGNFPEGDPFIECKRNNGTVTEIKKDNLRRMFYDEPRRKYVIFYNSGGNRDSQLKRITDCKLLTRTHVGVIESDETGTDVSFEFRDIRDYISPMF